MAVRLVGAVALAALPAVFDVTPAAAATSPGALPAATTAAVKIVDFDYQQRETTVDVGTTVTWTNDGLRPHTVTDRGGSFDSQPVQPGKTTTITFSVPGNYFYFCRINPSKMNGVITVRAGNAPAPVTRVQAVDPGNIAGESLRFDPPQLTVPVGGRLEIANVGGKPHTFTADDGSFSTNIITPGTDGGRFAGTTASLVLTAPGTFAFHCEIHPAAMKGTITVVGDAPAKPPPAASAGATTGAIEAKDFAFNPTEQSVGPGAKINVRNTGSAPHTVTFDDQPIDTGTIKGGGIGSFTAPTQPGSYSYRCTVHPAKMRGVLVVLGDRTPDPVAAAAGGTAKPAAATGGGKGTRVPVVGIVFGVLGALLGGIGIGAFVLRPKPNP